MMIDIKRGKEVFELFRNRTFQENWSLLYEHCPWATAFQSYLFVSRWYEIYQERFDPVILVKTGADGEELQGLLTLAVSRESGQLVVAGAHQAEYHVWLALPSLGNSFIEEALNELRVNFPRQTLLFRYLPPQVPREWLASTRMWGRRCILEPHSRPLIDVKDESRVKASLRKNHNKIPLKHLKRLGEVSFIHVTQPDELSAVFDEIVLSYDFRQGALSGTLPFQNDSLKKSFHLALMRAPSILHVTLFKLDNAIIAANLGVYDNRTVYLGVFAYSPFYAKYSPGKLHLLLLGEDLNQEGFSDLDLTPGGDWKDRLCSHHDEVYILRVFLGYRQLLKHKAVVKCETVAKSVVQRLGVRPQSLREAATKLRQIGVSHLFAAMFNRLLRYRRRLQCHTEVRVYTCRTDEVDKIDTPRLMSRDSVQDLLAFHQNSLWSTHQDFLSQALQWLEKGRHIYTRIEEGRLVHYGCLVERQDKLCIPEIHQEIDLPPDSAVLFDFYTDPQARSRGLCQASLRQMLHDIAVQTHLKQVAVYVLADNYPFRHAIEKVGFRHDSTMILKRGASRLEAVREV